MRQYSLAYNRFERYDRDLADGSLVEERIVQFRNFRVLCFDGYGSLIDWENGVVDALLPWLHGAGITASRRELLECFLEAEEAQRQRQDHIDFLKVLAGVHRAISDYFGVPASLDAAAAFAASIQGWPLFSDARGALAYLKEHYRLVLISNVERALLASAVERLGVHFDAIYTAEDLGGYHPKAVLFEHVIGRLAKDGIAKDRLLYVGDSLVHDHRPARRAGLSTCWIRREHGGLGEAKLRSAGAVDFTFDSLGAMADALWHEIGDG